MQKKLLDKFTKDVIQISPEIRTKALLSLIRSRKLTNKNIAEITGRRLQTVRCWTSAKNPRVIPLDALEDLLSYYGEEDLILIDGGIHDKSDFKDF